MVLGTAYGIPTGFIVDTHAARVAQRLGLTAQGDPAKIESDLCDAFPKSDWVAMGHRFVLHGRYVCTARKPACSACPLAEVCPSKEAEPEGSLKARCEAENALITARGN